MRKDQTFGRSNYLSLSSVESFILTYLLSLLTIVRLAFTESSAVIVRLCIVIMPHKSWVMPSV